MRCIDSLPRLHFVCSSFHVMPGNDHEICNAAIGYSVKNRFPHIKVINLAHCHPTQPVSLQKCPLAAASACLPSKTAPLSQPRTQLTVPPSATPTPNRSKPNSPSFNPNYTPSPSNMPTPLNPTRPSALSLLACVTPSASIPWLRRWGMWSRERRRGTSGGGGRS